MRRLTYRVEGDIKSFRNKVLCYRNDYQIAYLPTINGMPSDGYHRYVPYPNVKVDDKFWIANSYGRSTEKEWILTKDLDRYRWWHENYAEILAGCLAVARQ
jgi:hypothetical protein